MIHTLQKIFLASVIICTLMSGGRVLAAAGSSDFGVGEALKQSTLPTTVAGESTIPGVAGKILQFGLSFIGLVFFGLMFYAGFTWMSAMGNSEKVETAKAVMEAGIIGEIFVLAAYAITRFVFTSLS